MPMTLDKTYERILGAIDDIYFDEVRTALEWLAFSERPVSVAELAEACSIHLDDSEKPFLEEGGHDALDQLFGVISSLVMVNISAGQDQYESIAEYEPLPHKYDIGCYTQYVRLAHFSVKEYLVSNRLQQSHHARLSRYALTEIEVHRSLSRSCCEYLLYSTNEPQMKTWIDGELDEKIKQKNGKVIYHAGGTEDYMQHHLIEFFPAYPLLPYVCRNWYQHQALAEMGIEPLPTDGQIHVRVLDDDRANFSWLRVLNRYGFTGDNFYEGYKGTTALYWASVLGLRQTVSLLCDPTSHRDVCNVGGMYHSALQAAAFFGHEKIVEILIASGANVESQGGEYGTALIAAAYRGHEKIVEILIASGADVESQGGEYGTALIAAAYRGHEKIVEILIASGADVESQGGDFGTALIAAAFGDNEKIMEILIASGANVESQGGDFGTALIAAVDGGCGNIVSKLLQAKMGRGTLNYKTKTYGTALELAAADGDEHIVNELLQAGVDHGEAIMKAALEGHYGVVRILMKHGADLNVLYPGKCQYDDRYNTLTLYLAAIPNFTSSLLDMAMLNGSDDIVEELLEAGANSDTSYEAFRKWDIEENRKWDLEGYQKWYIKENQKWDEEENQEWDEEETQSWEEEETQSWDEEENQMWDIEENRKWIEEFKKSWDARVKPIAWNTQWSKKEGSERMVDVGNTTPNITRPRSATLPTALAWVDTPLVR
jgi:ankyrin repeat protein